MTGLTRTGKTFSNRNPGKINDLPDEINTNKIFVIRGMKVMIDHDLAELYGIETRRLKEQVRRNIDRFPEDLMFVFTNEEDIILRSQIAI